MDHQRVDGVLSFTIGVTDPHLCKILFSRRLLSGAYSRVLVARNSKKRRLCKVERDIDDLTIGPDPHGISLGTSIAEDRQKVGRFQLDFPMPVRMLPVEAKVAFEQGLIQLERQNDGTWLAFPKKEEEELKWDLPFPRTRFEQNCLAVYQDLWSKGWIVTLGTNFGCDYLLYTSDPGTTHSCFMVVIRDEEQTMTTKWLAICTLSTKVRKRVLLAEENEKKNGVDYTFIGGTLFRRADYLKGKQEAKNAIQGDDFDERGVETSINV